MIRSRSRVDRISRRKNAQSCSSRALPSYAFLEQVFDFCPESQNQVHAHTARPEMADARSVAADKLCRAPTYRTQAYLRRITCSI